MEGKYKEKLLIFYQKLYKNFFGKSRIKLEQHMLIIRESAVF